MTIWQRTGEGAEVTIYVNDKPLTARAGDSVATALMACGHAHFSNHPKTGKARAPQCLIGICFGCLCTVDGRPGTQACMELVREGLDVRIDGGSA